MEIKFVAFTEQRDNRKNYLVVRKFPIPLTGEVKEFDVEIPLNTNPVIFFTATTGMIETIGNMIDINHAIGYAFGNTKHKFKVQNPFNIPAKKRVYITEHLRFDGKPEYIVTQHRISQGPNNFVNFGYDNGQKIAKLIVDVITGEHKWV